MCPDIRNRRAAAAGLAAIALVWATGCGATAESESAADERPASRAEAPAPKIDANKAPRDITCGDLADPLAAAQMSRRAAVKLARAADIEELSELRASQSIYFAMTELCEANDDSYTPAAAAVAAVKRGKFRADLGAP